MAKKIYELSDEEKEKAKELLDFMSKNKNNTNSEISMDLPTANMSKPKNEMPVYDRSSSIDFPRVKIASQQETKNLKKFRESNNFTDAIDNVTGVLGNIGMGIENVIPNMTKYMNEGNKIATKKATNTIIRGMLNRATKNKEFSDKVGQIVGNTLGEKIHSSLNPIAKTNQELNNADIEKWRTNTIQNNISKTNNFLGTKLAELAPSIGNNALPMAVALAPVPGARALSTAMFMTSAGGSYLDDAKARGMNEDEAFGYATIMGTLEGGTEAVISGNMLNKGVKLASGHELSKEILGSYGLDITENFAQEAIMEPLSELTATITGGKESADWNNMGQRMINSGIDGALSAVLLSGVSAGIGSAVNVVNKHNNGQAVTQNEIKTAMKDIQNSGKINVEEVIKGSIEAIKGNNNINVEQNSLSTVNTENTYSNQLKQMASKEITNSNISEDYKTMMLDVLNNMNEVSDADVGSIRQNINSLESKNQTILNNQELPMQSYQYEKSDNAKINNLREDASKYFDNSKESHTYIDMLEKIIIDKDIDIRLDGNLKTLDGRVANGSYANGIITINPNSNRAGEFIAIHELTHAIGTKEMLNIVENYRKSNAEFDTSVKQLLGNYNSTEITEEALADVSAQLFGNQEFINNVANTNPSFFKKIYNEIKYLWHQFRGYKNQNEFVEDLYNKWTQAYNSSNNLNTTTNYYIETVADFNEIEYNNAKEIKLPKQEYAILSTIINSDSNIKPGINKIETTNAQYEIYFKETGEFKVLDKIANEGEDINVFRRTLSRNEEARSKRFNEQLDSEEVSNKRTGTYNDGISKNNSKGTYKRNRSNYDGKTNSRNDINTKYSMQESENNSKRLEISNNVRNDVYKATSDLVEELDNDSTFISTEDINDLKEKVDYYLTKESKDEIAQLYEKYDNEEIDDDFMQEIISIENNAIKDKLSALGYEYNKKDTNYSKINGLIESHEKILKYLDDENIKYEISKSKQAGIFPSIYIQDENGNIIMRIANHKNNNASIDEVYTNKELLDADKIIKDIGNKTKNINNRYSIQRESGSWQKYLENNFKASGTRTHFKDILVQKAENANSYTKTQENKQAQTHKSNELETSEWTKRKKEGEKRRKHYESIIRSNYTTDEAKAIAKSLMGTDTYVPESNSKQLELADDRISTTGADSELASLLSRATTGGTIKAEDIAIGERLIQYYSKTGNKAKLQDAIQATAMAGTTAGQTVQAMSLLNHQTPEGQAVWLQRSVDKMNKDLKRTRGEDAEQFKLTPEMLNKITNSENAKVLEQNLNEVYKELGQQVTKTTAQKIDAWRYFSMLANPRTHIRNIVGNTAMGGVQGIKNKVAGGIESAVSKINPDMERNHTIIPASKEVKAFAKADIENVIDRLGLNENKYNPKTRLENNMRTFKSDAMENTIGKAFDLNNKALEAEDGWGLKAGYVKALSEYMTANKLTPDTITDQQLGKARNFAIEQAKEATFHQDSQLASLINQLSNKNKFSKFVLDATLPFKKTPINVAKAGLEYSPVGLVKSAVYDTVQLRKGNITANKYIDNISKGLTGTGIALVGYALANCGVLKATGSDDEDKEKFEEGRGSQNYAITIGNNTYSLDWLAPSGIPLFIGAECYELMKTQKEKKTSSSDEDEYYNKVVDASMNILDSFSNAMNPMTEMSMLSGLTSALKSYDQGSSKMLAGIGTNSIKSYVNQFIPTALGQIAKTTDEYERNTTSTKTGVLPKAIDTTRTQIMNKIPGLRQKLPIKTDIWGQEQKQSDNIALRALENAVFPWARKELNSNNVDKEITKVYENTGESSVFPDTINKNLTIDKKKYVMTSKEFAKYKKQFGETSYELLKNLINSDGYKKLSDSQKQLAIEKIYSYSTEQVKIDYARQNCLKNEQSTLSQVTNAIKKTGGNTSNYFEFLANTQGLDKDSEKLEVLANSKYDEKTKKAIYENSLGKKDTKYDIVKESFTGSGLNMSKYLQYKAQEFKADKKDDGTVNGKSITGSRKNKVFDYIDSIKGATYTQKLILYALEYKLSSSSDREIIENHVRNLPNKTAKEKLEIMSKFAGVTLNKPDKEFPDGSYDY